MMRLRNQNGFSIIQALIAAGILAIFVAAFADMLLNMQKEVKRNKNKQDRILINYQIDQVVTSSYGLRGSAELADNIALKACVLGGAAGTCTTNCCQNDNVTQFYLLDPRDTNSNAALRSRLAGPVGDPQRYDDNSNNNCTNNCAYTVKSSFRAHCPGGVSTCDHAEHLQVQLEYEPIAGKEHLMKPTTKNLIYFVNVNYQPFLNTVPPQSISRNVPTTLSVYGNSGHPSEVQNFIFDVCESSNESLVRITCYGFSSGMGTLQLEGLSPGSVTIRLKINDGGTENNLSNEISFPVTVVP
jgi:hypothetical protein